MAKLEFTCPECGQDMILNVPAKGRTVECPSCEETVRVPPTGDAEAASPKRRRPPDSKGDSPGKTRGRSRKTTPAKKPVWMWVALAGAAAFVILGVAGVGLYMASGKGKPSGVAAVTPTTPSLPSAAPTRPIAAPTNPDPRPPVDPQEQPKKDPPKVEVPIAGAADIDRDWPTLPPRKRARAAADEPNRTRVRWYADPGTRSPLVVLDLPTEPFPPMPGLHRGLLARELARQAILLAARDEFGAATRDAALREASPPAAIDANLVATFELAWSAVPGKSARAALTAKGRAVWELEIPLPDAEVLDYIRLASALEGATRGPLAQALADETKSARLAGKKSSATSTQAIAARLDAANSFDAVLALQGLHAAIRTGGESPGLLVDLTRGYANAGLLTEHLDIATHKSFKARGLLYAHRAIAAQAPEGRWALAYASCLSGLHGRALEHAKAAGANPPGWAKVIGPAARHDADALMALPTKETGAIKDVLRFLALDNAKYTHKSTEVGLELLRTQKDCYRVADTLAVHSGLGVRRAMVETSLASLTAAIAERLGSAPNVPGAADYKKVPDAEGEAAFLQGLDADAGPEEPSFSSLAALVREQRAVHLARIVSVVDTALKLPAQVPVVTRLFLPYLAAHPRRELFEARADGKSVPQQRAAATKLPTSEIMVGGWTGNGFYYEGGTLYPISPSTMAEIAHADEADSDLRAIELAIPIGDRPAYAARFLKVSPDSPTAHAATLEYSWDKAAPNAAAWEKAFAGHALVLGGLADKYEALKRTDDAIRVWSATVKVAPENRGYLRLAGLYRNEKKDEAKGLSVMKERLSHPDTGLEHAAMRVQIAAIYAQKNDFKTALAFAEKAAEDSGAEWAMRAAAGYAARVGDAAKAAQWQERLRTRYGR